MGRLAGNRLGVQPNLYLLLLMGMLPDIDLVLGAFGLQHRTLTHSILFWSLLFAPVFVKYRVDAIPYFVAVSQHVLFGDLLVGKTSIFWPILDARFGLVLPIFSPVNLALEGAGFAMFCFFAIRNGDLELRKLSPLAVMVIIPLIGFVVLATFSESLLPIFLEGSDANLLERNLPGLLANPVFQAAVILHLALIAIILAYSVKSSLRKRLPQI